MGQNKKLNLSLFRFFSPNQIMDTALLSQFCEWNRVNNVSIRNAAHYLCNLSYSDVLDACANRSFPGTMVVSLSRKDLPKLQGLPPHHVLYDETHIKSWLFPTVRHVPEMTPPEKSTPPSSSSQIHTTSSQPVQLTQNQSTLNPNQLYFDLEMVDSLCVNPNHLCFEWDLLET